MRSLLSTTLVFLVLAFAVSCGNDSTPSEPNSGPTSDLSCDNPALAQSSALPFDHVEVTGISGIGNATWVKYEAPSGATGVTAVLVGEDGKARIVIPPNPDDLMNGGTLELSVTDGITTCAQMAIQVMPLTPATGNSLGDVVAALDEVTADFVNQFGLDANQVASTSLADLPPQAIPVALLLEARANFDPATALDGLTSDQAAFLQALLAKLGTASVLGSIHDSMTALSTGGAGTNSADASASPTHSKVASTSSQKASCGFLGMVPPDLFGHLSDAQSLSSFMKAARGAADTLGPLSQNISDTGTAFAVLGLAAPPVGAIAGWLAFGLQLIEQMRANLYPSSISRLEYQLTDTRLKEDWDTESGDPDYRWRFAKVWATNNGMGLARVGIDLITTGAALPDGFGSAAADAASGILDIAGKEALNHRLDQLNQDPSNGDECWSIGVTEFGPFAIDDNTGDKWVDGGVIDGEAVSMDPSDNRKIIPEQIGPATIRVHTQPEPFPGPIGFQDQNLEVVNKKVVWLPATLLVKNPGGSETVKFRVDDALHPDPQYVDVEPGPNLGSLPTPSYANGVYTLTFTTPSKRENYPTWIQATSTSKELPPSTPERSAKIQILLDEQLTIAPKDVCVSSGEDQTFVATVSAVGDSTVHWEIQSGAGQLSATTGDSITYTAPLSGSGTATIHAYLEQNSQVDDSVSFRYGSCSGLAAYYTHDLTINFPYGTGGPCSNPDKDAEYRVNTLPQDGIMPLVPPDAADSWVNRTESFSYRLQDGGNFGGVLPSTQQCAYGAFTADSGFSSTLTGSSDGTRLDIDVSTDATSDGVDMGELGIANSFATSAVSVVARFDFDLPDAANYQLTVDLTGSIYTPPTYPISTGTVTVIIVQMQPDGTPVPTNQSTQPINLTYDADHPTVSIDRVLQFTQPVQAEQVDHGTVVFTAVNTSLGAQPQETGHIGHTGSLQGYVSVTPVVSKR
jgi:hypothetical protein